MSMADRTVGEEGAERQAKQRRLNEPLLGLSKADRETIEQLLHPWEMCPLVDQARDPLALTASDSKVWVHSWSSSQQRSHAG
jgi:hypothetical protein